MGSSISPHDLQALMASDRLHAVIDVRATQAFREGQIFRATTMPRVELESRLPVVVPAPTLPTVFVGATTADGREAAQAAEAMGYTQTRWLDGGFTGWEAEDLPTMSGWNVPGKDFGERLLVREEVPEIESAELDDRRQAGERIAVLDVRTPAEFERSCIPGARNVPGGELAREIGNIVDQGYDSIVVNCAGRTRSITAAYLLQRMGVPNVRALRNGTMGWQLSDRNLEVGADRWQPQDPLVASDDASEAFAVKLAGADDLQRLSVSDLQSLLDGPEPVYLVDVRMPEEFAEGHIPSAIMCPAGQVVLRADDIIGVRGGHIVTCSSDNARAIIGAFWYRQMNYPRVHWLDGGVPAWHAAGLEMEHGYPPRPVTGPEEQVRDPSQWGEEEMKAYLRWEEELGRAHDASEPSSTH